MRALALAALLTLPLFATPVLAQDSGPTVRVVGGNIAVRTGPGQRYPVIGRIPNGTRLTIDDCTRESEWCHVTDTGWVVGSYLVGSAAKIRVTPPTFIDPFNPHSRGWSIGGTQADDDDDWF